MQQRTQLAYEGTNIEVGIWALQNLIAVTEEYLAVNQNSDPYLKKDLALAHGRLALLYRKQGDSQEYDAQVTKALAVGKDVWELDSFAQIEGFIANLEHNTPQ